MAEDSSTAKPHLWQDRRVVRATLITGAIVLLVAGLFVIRPFNANAANSNISPVPYNSSLSAPVPAGAQSLGQHDPNAQIRFDLVLHPQHESDLSTLVQHLTTAGDPLYHQWLTPAQFNARFAPPAIDTRWLTSQGIREAASSSPLVRTFTGTVRQIQAAFHTTINNYRTKDGRTVFANASAPMVPSSVRPSLAGIVGLDNVLNGKTHPDLATPQKLPGKALKPNFGAGVGGGLVPSQIRGIYDANPLYHATKGAGKTLAVFELSEYTHSDIPAYESAFGIPNVPINNILVDGGPCDPAVLGTLPCSYGAVEVNIDIELQLALAPGISQLDVYNGPNSDAGVLDTYMAIANQNKADVISTSWGQCEPSLDSGVAFGEFLSFAQMALQGQSIFSSSGDSGAYDCEFDFHTPPFPPYFTKLEVDDPTSDPLMTSVGGTSFFGTFDPGINLNPTYPTGQEYVWNTLNNCGNSDFIFGGQDLGLCPFGAGGGGNSTLWAKPFFQDGPGTTSSRSEFGAYCNQRRGVECREVPDVSINGDPNSGYAEYCTDTGAGCDPANPWFQIGGTSTAAPLWASIMALADSFGHERNGLATIALYNFPRVRHSLHDMVGGGSFTFQGVHYFTNSNGSGTPPGFPETRGYDMATGIGTPDITALALALR